MLFNVGLSDSILYWNGVGHFDTACWQPKLSGPKHQDDVSKPYSLNLSCLITYLLIISSQGDW